jgi:hypothetical protein
MKKILMALAVLALIAGGVKAADPDYTWREAVRAVIGTNGVKDGVIPASALNSNIVTNVLAEGMVLPAVDGNAVTNLSPATAFPGYAVCVVTNLDVDGTTNIMTYIGAIAREQ